MDRKEIQVLPTGMHDLLNPLIADKLPKLIEAAIRQHRRKIDDGRRPFGRDLNQLELGNETVFPDEFRIQRQTGTVTEPPAQLAERVAAGNVLWWSQHHLRSIIQMGCRDDPAGASVPCYSG